MIHGRVHQLQLRAVVVEEGDVDERSIDDVAGVFDDELGDGIGGDRTVQVAGERGQRLESVALVHTVADVGTRGDECGDLAVLDDRDDLEVDGHEAVAGHQQLDVVP